MTPEQHANTVREAFLYVAPVHASVVRDAEAALLALAERADTLERERDEALRQRNEWAERVGVLRDLRDREGSWGAPYERAVLATDLAQARAEADRLRAERDLLAMHVARPRYVNGKWSGKFLYSHGSYDNCGPCQLATVISRAALAGPTESAEQASPGPQTKEQT